MSTAFDSAAATYDRTFTHSRLGMAQRRQVWAHLDRSMPSHPLRVLELNCGTGIDALHMAGSGHHVLATDASEDMLAAAAANAQGLAVRGSLEFAHMDFNDLAALGRQGEFDRVLSDFGGLNCTDAAGLTALCEPMANALKQGGRFIAVLMSDRCIAETAYFLLKGRMDDAFRRWKGRPVHAAVGDGQVRTWYHSPGTVSRIFARRFRVRHVRPIGFFVPPGYLEPRFVHRPRLVRQLGRGDERLSGQRWMARFADHYLIDLERVR